MREIAEDGARYNLRSPVAQEGVTMLLALQPELIGGVDTKGQNSVMLAIKKQELAIATQLLDTNPELIHDIDPQGRTLLHYALEFIIGDTLEHQAFVKKCVGKEDERLACCQ